MPHSCSWTGAPSRWTAHLASNRLPAGQLTWSMVKGSSRCSSLWSRTCHSRQPRTGSIEISLTQEPDPRPALRPGRVLGRAPRVERSRFRARSRGCRYPSGLLLFSSAAGAENLKQTLERGPDGTREPAPSGPAHEVDRHGHALELEVLAQPVLDPVAVVARDQARVVDEEAEARRADAGLRAGEENEGLAVPRRGVGGLPPPRPGRG